MTIQSGKTRYTISVSIIFHLDAIEADQLDDLLVLNDEAVNLIHAMIDSKAESYIQAVRDGDQAGVNAVGSVDGPFTSVGVSFTS